MKRALAILLAAGLLAVPGVARADAVTVAAAADVRYALDEIVSAFHQRHSSAEVKVTYGASGTFFAQISSGAPFDLFFSADEGYPRQLVDSGRAVAESLTVYGVGRLVLWVPKDSPLDLGQGLASLRDPRARRIAIANPAHAPYGRAAEAALRASGVYAAVLERLVVGESAAQAAQFVESGNADAALLPLALAMAPALSRAGRYVIVPAALYPPLRQAVVVTERARGNVAAAAFLRFVVGPEGRAILERWGFGAGR